MNPLNPMDWVNNWLFELLEGFIEGCLNTISDFFEKSITNVQTAVVETPMEFSPTLLDTIRTVSETCILPVAGILLTYLFCYELFTMITEKNRGGDFDTGQLIFLIIKTAVMINLVTHAFDIALAFSDLGKWITDQVPKKALVLPDSITDTILSSLSEDNVGEALLMAAFSAFAALVAMIMNMIVFLVAWSRIITILLYVSIAPLPLVTIMNRDWVGSIGQNYLKNLIALMLQGFFMIICIVVYGGLLEKVSNMLVGEESVFFTLSLFLVSMGILVVMLTRTHSLAKSVVGAT